MALMRGLDISHWQGNPNLRALRDRWNLEFIGIKATEGSGYSDPTLARHRRDARQAGLVPIYYHFARPGQSSGASQARRLVAAAKAKPGELLCLDLETSPLNQAATNRFARDFAAELRRKAPGINTVVYLGLGYASNGTGRDLADHFDCWWFPRYRNRNGPWPASFTPGHPAGGGTTGWSRPHIWQWTDNAGGAYDGNVSWLTRAQLSSGSEPEPEPEEDDDVQYRVYQIEPQTVTGLADVVVHLGDDVSVALGADMQYWITVDLKVGNVVEAGQLRPYQWDPADEAVYFDDYHPEPVKIGATRVKLVQNGVVTHGRHLRLAVSGRFQITDGRVDMNFVKVKE